MRLDYKAPPTCAAFMRSEAFGRLLLGPIGSGKTTACLFELFRRACEQAPAKDGYRYTRFAIVRQTLKELRSTVLKDIQNWFQSNGLGEFKVSENTFYLDFGDVRSEWPLIPLDQADDQARLLSMQLTSGMLSEFVEMDFGVLAPLSGRVGRYPSGERGLPSWFGLIGDSNMPVELSPWHKFLEDLPASWQKFVQPGGLSPNAENLNWLLQKPETACLPVDSQRRIAQGRTYYERLVETYGASSDWVRRYVDAEYGNDPSGLAVFRESFKTSFHVVPETTPIPGYPLIIGQDFGRNPWSLICQVDHMGRLLVHEEVSAANTGLEKHVNEHLRPVLFSKRYSGYSVAMVGDPAGVAKGSIAEESCFDALKRLGFPAFPASTNNIDPRLRAVEALLLRQSNGGPALMIDGTRCPQLVRALAGAYRFTRTREGDLRPVPDKGDESHVVDCLQYACLVVHGGMMNFISTRLKPKRYNNSARVSSAGWT